MEELTANLDRVVALYWIELDKANRGEEFELGPWIVAIDVPRIIFDAWILSVSGVWKLSYTNEKGRVLLYADPSPPHARGAGWLLTEFSSEITEHFGRQVKHELHFSTSEDYNISGYGVKVHDMSILEQSQIPSVVAEVGYRNERNFDEVKVEVDLWVFFGVLIVIGIKITDIGRGASMENPLIEVIAKIQGCEDQVFTLSHNAPNPCVSCGTHEIVIPSGLLLSQAQLAFGP